MPIDASIPLQMRPAQPIDPLESYARVMQLKQLASQGQMQQLQMQQAQQQMADDQATRKLFSGSTPPTDAQVVTTLGSKGFSIVKLRHETEAADLDLKSKKIAHDQKVLEVTGQELANAKDQPTYDQALTNLQGYGVDISKMNPQYDGPTVEGYKLKGLTIEQALGQKKAEVEAAYKKNEEDRKAAEFGPKLTETQNRAAISTLDLGTKTRRDTADQLAAATSKDAYARVWYAIKDPNLAAQFTHPDQFDPKTTPGQVRLLGMSAKEQTDAEKADRPTEWSTILEAAGGDPRKALDLRSRMIREGRPVTNVGGTPMSGVPTGAVTGQDFMDQLKAKQPGLAARVQGIVEGRETAPTGRAATMGLGAQIMDSVYRADPQWNAQRAQLRKAFTSGPDGRNIGNLNTAPVHLGRLYDAALAMKNGSWQPGNELYNWFATKFGSDKVTNYNYVMNALAGETASALKGNATDPEIAHVITTLQNNMSPDQSLGVAKEGLQVMGDKLNTYYERYQQQSNGKDPTWSPVLPSAKAVFDRFGINPTAGPESLKAGGGGNAQKTIVQHSPSTGQYRYSTDGGKTWQAGQPK